MTVDRRGIDGMSLITIVGETGIVELTQGRFAIIDAADASLIGQNAWSFRTKGSMQYAFAKVQIGEGVSRCTEMQRVIMAPESGQLVDHINGDGLDNRRSNLRIASWFENAWNSRTRHDNKCGIKGVYFDKRRGVWVAKVTANKQTHHLGQFKTAAEAASARAAAAIRLHGSFARLK